MPNLAHPRTRSGALGPGRRDARMSGMHASSAPWQELADVIDRGGAGSGLVVYRGAIDSRMWSSSSTGRPGGSVRAGSSAPAAYQRSSARPGLVGVSPERELVQEHAGGLRHLEGAR